MKLRSVLGCLLVFMLLITMTSLPPNSTYAAPPNRASQAWGGIWSLNSAGAETVLRQGATTHPVAVDLGARDPDLEAVTVLVAQPRIWTGNDIRSHTTPEGELVPWAYLPLVARNYPLSYAKAEPGQEVNMVLLPKFLGLSLFDQAHSGAQEAHMELENPGELQYLGPTLDNPVEGQIAIVITATLQGMDAIMISNVAGDQIAPAAQAARDEGMTVVTWDSPIPSAEGEQVFVAPVDFDETGKVMADMALSILGDDGGEFAVLSASPDAANQNAWIAALAELLETDSTYANLELIDIVYGNDQLVDSYNQALALVDKYPNMELIMAPTTVGIVAAAQAMQDEGLCDTVKVSGLGLPEDMAPYTLNGCAPEFAFWSFTDLGYLTYYVTYLLATGAMEGKIHDRFEAGRMGIYTVEKDPTRVAGFRVVMGFTVYTVDDFEDTTK
jgi:rhamnose transport system substrate-binding protein